MSGGIQYCIFFVIKIKCRLTENTMWRNISKIAKEFSGLYIREVKMVISDSGTLLFFVIAVFAYPLLYALAYEKETVKDLPIAVVDLDHTAASRQFGRMADATEQLKVAYKPGSLMEAQQLFFDTKIRGIILIPENFEKDILNGIQTNVTVYCDASYFMLYKQVYSGAVYSTGTFGAKIELKRLLSQGKSFSQAVDIQEPVKTEIFNLYNPSGGYGSFIMPGMVIIIIQQLLLIGIGMLGGTIREKNIFPEMNNPVIRSRDSMYLVLAKATAYVSILLITSLFPLVIMHHWFNFPDNGHFVPIFLLFTIYLYSVSFLGLAISILFKKRVNSILFMVFISPLIAFLSGISWPVSSVPPVLHFFSQVFPCIFMVPAYIKLRIIGSGLNAVHFESIMLIIQMIVYFLTASLAYKFAVIKFIKKADIPE
jgi:ABC-2 type transport system permease protein